MIAKLQHGFYTELAKEKHTVTIMIDGPPEEAKAP